MGATVTCGVLAGAFAHSTGQTFYVLFENTYETNCYPHTPSWSCVHFGPLEATLRYIFRCASVCEGGCLKGTHGHITPETYIDRWMKALAAPHEMPDTSLTLFSNASWRTPIPVENLDKLCEQMSDLGYGEHATTTRQGTHISLSLHADAPLIAALYAPYHIAPWRVIDSYLRPTNHPPAPALAYKPEKGDIKPPKIEAVAIQSDYRLLKRDGADWYCAGPAYNAVATYVTGLWLIELNHPGCYRRLIQAYRRSIAVAPEASEPIIVRVDVAALPDRHGYFQQRIAKLKTRTSTRETDGGLEIDFSADLAWELASLPPEQTTWILTQSSH